MNFVGVTGAYNATLVNPYSGYTVTISGVKNVNNGIYNGMGGNDTLIMTSMGDVLMLVDSMGTIMVMNVEQFNAGADGDVIILADANVNYGNVIIRGSTGDDILWSNNGNDTILGGEGGDTIDGGGGNDLLFGDQGNDYLSGGLGNDSLFAGEGDDTLVYSVDAIWSGGVTLAGLGSALPFAASINLDGMNQSFDNFNGDATDSLVAPTVGYDTLVMTSGDDVLVLSDTLSPGNASFFPRVSYMEEIDAGEGNDIVDLSGGEHIATTIHGGDGNDILAGSTHDDALYGDADNDRLMGGAGNDMLSGGEGDDAYYYNLGNGSDTIIENTGTDSISFGPGIVLADLDFEVSGLDLLVTIGNKTLTIQNHYAADLSGRVESLMFDDASTFDLIGFVPNDAPVANDDTFSGDEDAVISGNVLANDTDANDDVLTVTPATIATANGGTIVLNANGSFTYQGAANFNGTDGFSYTADDGRGGVSNANVTITIAAINDAPVAGDDQFSGNEDEAIAGSLLGNDSDTEGDALSLVGQTITTASGGSVTINADGTFSYLGAANFHGTDSFDYTVLDGNGGSDIGTVSLTIAAVNDGPIANDDSFSGDEDTEITGDLLANDTDVDGDTLTTVAETITTSNGGTVTLNTNGTFSYIGATNFNGTDGFNYTVIDGNGGTATAQASLTIAAVNDAPVAQNDAFAGDEDTTITGSVLANDTDIDGDVLSAVAETIATANGGSVVINADGTFSYVGATNFNGTDGFDYTTIDGNGGTATTHVDLTIGEVNDGPVANDDSYAGNEDAPVTGNVLDNDADEDGDTLSAVAGIVTTAQGGTVTLNADGTFSYAGAVNFNGADGFDYTTIDGNGGLATAHVDLAIAAVNDGPVAQDDAFEGNEDTVITGNVLANDTDVDGDALSVTAANFTTANGGTVTLNANGTFSYSGAANFNGGDSFNYTARDTSGATSTATVLLSISAVNDAPVANNDVFNGLRNGSVTGNVLGNDTDIDGDTLSAQAGTYATQQGGTVVLNTDGSFTYTPADNFYGADSFDYTTLDSQGGSDTATMAFSIDLDPSQSIIGTEDGETITGTPGNDEIFGLGGNDILYGDDGVLTGTTMDKTFVDANIMPELREGVNISKLRPKGDPALGIGEGNLTVDYDATATITFRKGFAGYDNSFGVFGIAADGTIVDASMEWKNVKTAGINTAHDIDLPVGTEGGAYGFFVIANGNNTNNGYAGLNVTGDGVISFVYNYGKSSQRAATINDPGNKVSIVYNDGNTVKVLKGDVYLTTERGDSTSINEDGKMHVVSGLMDTNNVTLNVKAGDLASKPVSFTKNDITVSALTGTLIGNGDRIGVKSPGAGNTVGGSEALHVGLANGAEKITISLSDIAGGNTGIDLKIYLNGNTTPVVFEYVTGSVSKGLLDIVLKSSDFGGGVITGVEISSVANSSRGTETFYLDNIYAEIPGGTDTNTLRIGFEDLYGRGDADYEDVLFDLDIKPVTAGDVTGGNDVLDGGQGNDTLYGEGGNDILFIGLDADHAFGGAGNDVFALNAIDGDVDTIHDFGADDSINITDVLDSYDPLNDDIADFVRLVQVGSDMQLQINEDGDVGGAFVNAALILGGAGTTDVAALITSGALVADHSALA